MPETGGMDRIVVDVSTPVLSLLPRKRPDQAHLFTLQSCCGNVPQNRMSSDPYSTANPGETELITKGRRSSR